MSPRARLLLCGAMIVFSALYASIIAFDPRTASAIMLGYIGLLLTVYVASTIRRRQ